MNKIYILIGNIGSGKTTWKERAKDDFLRDQDKPYVVSRDNIRYALGDGVYLFDHDFESIVREATSVYFEKLLFYDKQFIIIDETNMSCKARKRIFKIYNMSVGLDLCAEYHIVAVVFPDAGRDEHVRRRMMDNHGPTMEIKWNSVYDSLKAAYEPPIGAEGFDEIIYL